MPEYVIQSGDTFFRLAQRLGCNWQDLMRLNPTLNPYALQVGQKIVLPDVHGYQHLGLGIGTQGESGFLGQSYDDVEVDIEGVKFRVKRVGEHRVPHEVHVILPRTEIHKVQCSPHGNSELRLMISNINIVNAPRLMSGETGNCVIGQPGYEEKARTESGSRPSPEEFAGMLSRDELSFGSIGDRRGGFLSPGSDQLSTESVSENKVSGIWSSAMRWFKPKRLFRLGM